MAEPLPLSPSARIDAVISWVDGRDPQHLRKRMRWLGREQGPLSENAVNPHRWNEADELGICLRSIALNAPWLRRVFIVTDAQTPDLPDLPGDFAAKIRLIDHAQIFAGTGAALPSFNSLSIETALWRIPGLSERFLYFNDDVFLTAPLDPGDMFQGRAPVLRGAWRDLSAMLTPDARADPALLNHVVQVNAAILLGVPPARVFQAAHVVHPLRRSVMADLAARFADQFAQNLSHRFRAVTQFQPMALHNHACILADQAAFLPARDDLHIHSGLSHTARPEELRALLTRAREPGIRFLCVNDLPHLESRVPDARVRIEQALRSGARAA
jgi:hypothetical protein